MQACTWCIIWTILSNIVLCLSSRKYSWSSFATSIQKGRDTGLSPYSRWKSSCFVSFFYIAFLYGSTLTFFRAFRIPYDARSRICLFNRSNKTRLWEWFFEKLSLFTSLATSFNVSHSEASYGHKQTVIWFDHYLVYEGVISYINSIYMDGYQ